MTTLRADWKRLQIGDVVTGFDGATHGNFTGVILRYERVEPVRKNLPLMIFATVRINEYGSTVTQNFSALTEAYDDSRSLVQSDIYSLPLRR